MFLFSLQAQKKIICLHLPSDIYAVKVYILHKRCTILFANAQQAKVTCNCRNIKEKMLKASAAIWFNDDDTL
jgi:hypothetical protein